LALTIKGIPTLKSNAAKDFVAKAEASYEKKGKVDFSKQIALSKRIWANANI
jgi:hypothetical protein